MTSDEFFDWNLDASYLDGIGTGICLSAVVTWILVRTGGDASYITLLSIPAYGICNHYSRRIRGAIRRGLEAEREAHRAR